MISFVLFRSFVHLNLPKIVLSTLDDKDESKHYLQCGRWSCFGSSIGSCCCWTIGPAPGGGIITGTWIGTLWNIGAWWFLVSDGMICWCIIGPSSPPPFGLSDMATVYNDLPSAMAGWYSTLLGMARSSASIICFWCCCCCCWCSPPLSCDCLSSGKSCWNIGMMCSSICCCSCNWSWLSISALILAIMANGIGPEWWCGCGGGGGMLWCGGGGGGGPIMLGKWVIGLPPMGIGIIIDGCCCICCSTGFGARLMQNITKKKKKTPTN